MPNRTYFLNNEKTILIWFLTLFCINPTETTKGEWAPNHLKGQPVSMYLCETACPSCVKSADWGDSSRQRHKKPAGLPGSGGANLSSQHMEGDGKTWVWAQPGLQSKWQANIEKLSQKQTNKQKSLPSFSYMESNMIKGNMDKGTPLLHW